MSEGQLLGDEAAVGMAENDDPLVAELAGERSGIVGQLLDRDRVSGRATGASVAPVVQVHQTQSLLERRQRLLVQGVVESQPTMEHETRRTGTDGVVPDRRSVHVGRGHRAVVVGRS